MNGPAEGAAAAPTAQASALYSRSQAYAVLAAMVLFTLCLDLAKLPMNVMVDPIRRTLGISDVQISLLLGAVGAAPFVVMSLVGGWLSDRLSRRLLLAVAIAVWTLGAVICAHATSFEMLVAGRVLVHVGAGMKLPLAMTWVNDAFPPEQRGRAVGAFFVVLGSGPSLAIMLAGAVQRAAEGGAFAAWPGLAGADAVAIRGLRCLSGEAGLEDAGDVAARHADIRQFAIGQSAQALIGPAALRPGAGGAGCGDEALADGGEDLAQAGGESLVPGADRGEADRLELGFARHAGGGGVREQGGLFLDDAGVHDDLCCVRRRLSLSCLRLRFAGAT